MMCKRVFRVKLFVSSIHSCIHHYYYHLYPNTQKDMAWMVSRLLLQVLPVAYQLIVVTGIPSNNNNIHRTDANVCSEWKGGRSPLFISSVILLLLSSSSSIQEDEDTHHYYFYHHHSLCPKSTLTQKIKIWAIKMMNRCPIAKPEF